MNDTAKFFVFKIVPKDGDNVSVLTDTNYVDFDKSDTLIIGDLGRDMGRRITLVGDNGLVSVVLARVLTVDGPVSEGVPELTDIENTYVVAFTANPSDTDIGPVGGARTG